MSFNVYHIKAADFFSAGGGSNGEVIITRDNYEEYFVMYIDDELDATTRKAVEYFVQQNPDLEEELVMLQQSILRPDEHIVFDQKESLFKNTAAQGLVNENNYEEYFVMYGDDELTNEEKDQVEKFVYKHPQYQEDFELIQQVKLVPDNTITFPGKAYLFRTEEDDNKVVAFPWWYISAAAIALLVLGTFGWYVYTTNHIATTGQVAVTNSNTEQNITPKDTTTNDFNASKATDQNNVAVVKPPVATDKKADALANSDQQPVQQKAITVNNKKNISTPRNIPLAQNVSPQKDIQMKNKTEEEKVFKAKPVQIAVVHSYTTPAVNTDIIQTRNTQPLAVTTAVADLSEEKNTQNGYAVNAINKTPLRGFFRKVSRVVDRVTNPDENNKGSVRIANIEIALK